MSNLTLSKTSENSGNEVYLDGTRVYWSCDLNVDPNNTTPTNLRMNYSFYYWSNSAGNTSAGYEKYYASIVIADQEGQDYITDYSNSNAVTLKEASVGLQEGTWTSSNKRGPIKGFIDIKRWSADTFKLNVAVTVRSTRDTSTKNKLVGEITIPVSITSLGSFNNSFEIENIIGRFLSGSTYTLKWERPLDGISNALQDYTLQQKIGTNEWLDFIINIPKDVTECPITIQNSERGKEISYRLIANGAAGGEYSSISNIIGYLVNTPPNAPSINKAPYIFSSTSTTINGADFSIIAGSDAENDNRTIKYKVANGAYIDFSSATSISVSGLSSLSISFATYDGYEYSSPVTATLTRNDLTKHSLYSLEEVKVNTIGDTEVCQKLYLVPASETTLSFKYYLTSSNEITTVPAFNFVASNKFNLDLTTLALANSTRDVKMHISYNDGVEDRIDTFDYTIGPKTTWIETINSKTKNNDNSIYAGENFEIQTEYYSNYSEYILKVNESSTLSIPVRQDTGTSTMTLAFSMEGKLLRGEINKFELIRPDGQTVSQSLFIVPKLVIEKADSNSILTISSYKPQTSNINISSKGNALEDYWIKNQNAYAIINSTDKEIKEISLNESNDYFVLQTKENYLFDGKDILNNYNPDDVSYDLKIVIENEFGEESVKTFSKSVLVKNIYPLEVSQILLSGSAPIAQGKYSLLEDDKIYIYPGKIETYSPQNFYYKVQYQINDKWRDWYILDSVFAITEGTRTNDKLSYEFNSEDIGKIVYTIPEVTSDINYSDIRLIISSSLTVNQDIVVSANKNIQLQKFTNPNIILSSTDLADTKAVVNYQKISDFGISIDNINSISVSLVRDENESDYIQLFNNKIEANNFINATSYSANTSNTNALKNQNLKLKITITPIRGSVKTFYSTVSKNFSNIPSLFINSSQVGINTGDSISADSAVVFEVKERGSGQYLVLSNETGNISIKINLSDGSVSGGNW